MGSMPKRPTPSRIAKQKEAQKQTQKPTADKPAGGDDKKGK